MKAKTPETKKEFVPFELTLTVESEKEARTLFHIFNCNNMHDVITEKYNFYDMHGYKKELSSIACSEARDIIKEKVNVRQTGEKK